MKKAANINFIVYLVALFFFLPIAIISFSLFSGYDENFLHISQTVLPKYIKNTIYLISGVGLLTFFLGTISAYLITFYKFPGRKFFKIALLFPLLIPAYIAAFTYAGIFEYAGPVQTFLRDVFSWQKDSNYFPQVRSISGAIFILSFILYPYVYMMCIIAFKKSRDLALISSSMGISGLKMFLKVIIPTNRPAIIAGLSLVLMEALADFGAVQHLAVDTFTTGIYRSWYVLGDHNIAAKLSAFLLFFVILVIGLEKSSRGKKQYSSTAVNSKNHPLKHLNPKHQLLAISFCFLTLFFGLLLPLIQLIIWAIESLDQLNLQNFINFTTNSVTVALIAAIVAASVALVFVYSSRTSKSSFKNIAIRFSSIGYAIPGSVAAVGILIFLSFADKKLDALFSTGLLLSGTIFSLIFAYVFRFFAIAFGSIDSGMSKISKEIDYVCKTLGKNSSEIISKIHTPALMPSIMTACLFVFIESIKELPATLIMHPFNFETLATYTYQLASDERLAESSIYALMIIITGLFPIFVMARRC